MNVLRARFVLLLISFVLAQGVRLGGADVPAEVRVLRRTLTPLVDGLTNTPNRKLEELAPTRPLAALALAWRLAHAKPPDATLARRWVERAAEAGNPVAQFAFGAIAADADRDTDGELLGDFETARDWWEKAAAQGHVEAAIRLGDALWDGSLGTNDGAGAQAAWQRAVGKGNPDAERRLGLLFLCWREGAGLFTDSDPDAARQWFTRAVQHGDAASRRALRYLHVWEKRAHDEQRPLREWLSAKLRNPAEESLGWVLRPEGPKDEPNIALDGAAGFRELKDNLEQGHEAGGLPLAGRIPKSPADVPDTALRHEIAALLWDGAPGFPAQPQRAIHWFLAAARAGSAPAMRRLGEFWEQGVNGEPDPAEAKRWFRRAELAEKAGAKPDSASPQVK
jgi:TPR repeat protein